MGKDEGNVALILTGTEPNNNHEYQALKITSARTTTGNKTITYTAGEIDLLESFQVDSASSVNGQIQDFTPTNLAFTYVIRDHLGNNRVFFWDSTGNNSLSTNEIRAVRSYYPFGMDMRQANNINPEFKYGFGDKEELEYTGYLSFGARCMFRDAAGQLHRCVTDSAGIVTTIDKIGRLEFRNGALSVIHHDNGYVTFNRAVPEDLVLDGTVTHTATEQAVTISSGRILDTGADEDNIAQEGVSMFPPFEVKLGAEYLADTQEFPVQGLAYHYIIKDHLGSPRVIFQDINNNGSIQPATEVEDIKEYYPFGMEWDDPEAGVPQYRQSYNNKEQVSHTKYLDFGARCYIKSAIVFDGPDPISDRFPHVTTINYAENSPVTHIDLWGLQAWEINRSRLKGEVKIPSQRAESDWIGPAIGYAIAGLTAIGGGAAVVGRFGLQATAGFVANEIKDEVASQLSGGFTDVLDATKMGTKIFQEGVRSIAKFTSKNIHKGKQGKHIAGHNNFQAGKSKLTGDAQGLLDDFHGGDVNSVGKISDTKTRVDFGKEIGTITDKETGEEISTTIGIIHNSKTGAHIVPAQPKTE